MIIAAIKISIWLVLVQGRAPVNDTQLDINGAMYVWHEIETHLRELGYEPRLRRFRVIKDPAPAIYSRLDLSEQRLSKFAEHAYSQRWLRRNRAIHYITPRTLEGYMVGWSAGVCSYKAKRSFQFQLANGRMETRGGAVSYSTGQYKNIAGWARLEHSWHGALHEIAHDIGAGHVESKTVMNKDPLGVYNSQQTPLPWDVISVEQINQCLAR